MQQLLFDYILSAHVRRCQIINDSVIYCVSCLVQMVSGYLRASGLVVQRNRVRQSLKRIDPLGSACRWGKAVTRRTYSVPTPNSLWHLDSHMKLVRYVFAVLMFCNTTSFYCTANCF